MLKTSLYIQAKSDPITVNGQVFASTREAARFIHGEEEVLGNKRNCCTIRQELQRIRKGIRREGWMYELYEITNVPKSET